MAVNAATKQAETPPKKPADILHLPKINAKVLTQIEHGNLREPFFLALTALWEGMDKLITYTNAKGAEAFIWQGIDSEDTYFLVDTILDVSKVNAIAAEAVRAIVSVYKQLRVGVILFPRFIETVQFYAQNGGFGFGLFMPKGAV